MSKWLATLDPGRIILDPRSPANLRRNTNVNYHMPFPYNCLVAPKVQVGGRKKQKNNLWAWVNMKPPGNGPQSLVPFARASHFGYPFLTHSHMAMGQIPNRTPREHPNPTTKIGSKMGGEFTQSQPKWDPKTFLTATAI